jgi:signal transduction histidine kinase/CheY-like chemotaxis protein
LALDIKRLWRTGRRPESGRAREGVDHRLVAVLGTLTDPFVTFDAGWRFSFVNDVAAEILRQPRERLLGRNVWEEFPDAVGMTSHVELHRAMTERVAVEYETYYEPWGRWFYAKAYPTADGGLAVFFRDISEQKATNEALQDSRRRLEADLAAMTRLQKLSNQLVPADELSSHLDQILTVAAEITGTDKANIQLAEREKGGGLRIIAHRGYGKRFVEHFSCRGASEICDAAARRMERIIIEDVKHEAALAGSEDRDVLLEDGIRALVSTPLVARDGQLLGVLNSHFRFPHRPSDHVLRYVDLLARMTADVIERSIVERTLHEKEGSERSARREAERASAIKDEFLSTLSHELRSPLNAILGWVRILEKRPTDAKLADEGIEVISRNAKAQSDLIADLLDMNRILSGKVRLEISNVGLSEVIREAIDTMRPAAESKQIRMEQVLSPSADAVRGDPSRLQQVLCNLLSNAVKFTPKGGRVQVTLKKTGSQADIVISDTGTGIDAKFLPHVFDRFRQGDASTTRRHGGLGLGLAIVKQLVELHGGTAHAESAGEGRGATFTISLPLALMQVAPVAGTAAPDAPQSAEDVDLAGITILAVEDQSDARELLRVVLERCHARVLTAGSADEALTLLDTARPDIILCDVGMPGKDGYEFIVELRRRQNLTPALAVTAFARTEDKVRALRAGFHAHVAKPIEPAELLSTVAVFARTVRH